MPTSVRRILVALLLIAASSEIRAQGKKGPKLNEDIDAPSDFALDTQLAINERAKIRAGAPLDIDPQLSEVGAEVFAGLLKAGGTSISTLPYKWSLTIIKRDVLNAYSLPDGEISVEAGLAHNIGADRNMWAAVLSHEIVHTYRRHAVRQYLFHQYVQQQIQYYKYRAALGDKAANWAVLGLAISGPLLEKKMARNFENEADTQGMLLMAAAGYHPDAVFALHHLMRVQTGDQSKFAAFFADHPRWETRDQRSEKAYAGALDRYNSQWPVAADSPGGIPPAIAFLGQPHTVEDKSSGTADISIDLSCRNVTGPIHLLARFTKDGKPIVESNAQYKDKNGNLALEQAATCKNGDDVATLKWRMPSELVAENSRKTDVQITIFDDHNRILEQTKRFGVQFPRLDKNLAAQVASNPRPVELDVPPSWKSLGQSPTPTPTLTIAANEKSETPTQGSSLPQSHPPYSVSVNRPKVEVASRSSTNPLGLSFANPQPEVKPGWIGLLAEADGSGALRITHIQTSGPAEGAGLMVGDYVVAIEGESVRSVAELASAIAKYPPGTKLNVSYRHLSWQMTATLMVAESR